MEAAALSAAVSMMLKIVGNKLAPLLIKEYSYIMGVKRDLQELRGQVEEINSWLETRYEAMWNDPSFNWLKRLKEVAYAVDDVVDEFQLKAEKHVAAAAAAAGVMSKDMFIKPKSFILQCKVASKIKAIKKRFAAIVKQRAAFITITHSSPFGHPVHNTNMTTLEMQSLPIVDATSVLGRDQDKNIIITELVKYNAHQELGIVSIVGLGGSGKSTLAKLIFSDGGTIKKHFELTLWVHVSQEFNITKLVEKLFEAIAEEKSDKYPLQHISAQISKRLNGKKFLLVLDDIWTEQRIQWEQFMVHLMNGASGSKILLTTRSRRVAESMESIYIFDLPFLSLDDSWQLFCRSFGSGVKGLSSEFQEVGKEIVKKCGGMPLAIKSLAGVLCGKDLIEEWQAIRDNNLFDVQGEEHRVAACLRLTYFHLSSNLKQCFTICSVFPKGHKLDKGQLIDLWIAHDMICAVDGVDYLDYIGHKHFNSLVKMSFLQNVEEEYGRVICRMHDLVHDLAQFILGDEISLVLPKEEENSTMSCRYFSLSEQPEDHVPKDIFRKARAVYMPWYGEYTHGMEQKHAKHTYGIALKHAKHLRSVMVDYLDAEEANTISQVKYLKYLSMSLRSCETLPESISNVWSLQALHVAYNYSLLKLPESIGNLQKLRTLNLSWCTKLKCLPESIGECQMITSIDLSKCMELTVLPDSIGRNEKLRVLRLRSTKIKRLPSTITTLRNLECLDVQGCRLVELPEGIGNMENLQVLNLKDCSDLVGMPVGIGQLSRLENLGLFVVGKVEKFAGISELANVSRIGEELTIIGIQHVMDTNDTHIACLKQKTNLQKLNLQFSARPVGVFRFSKKIGNFNTEIESVLDDLDIQTESVLDGLNIETESVLDGSYIETESVFDGPGTEYESVLDDLDTETESTVDDLDIETESLLDGHDTEVELVVDGLDIETESVLDGWDTEIESVLDGWDTESKSILDGLDTEYESVLDTLDTETESIVDGFDTETESVLDGQDTETKSVLDGLDTETESVLDGLETETESVLNYLEPPPGIKELEIDWYSGRKYARWMQNQVGGGAHNQSRFPFLRVMRLSFFRRLKNLHGLVELPCLEELELCDMPCLESLSGGPFPLLVKLRMSHLPCLREVWIVAERTVLEGQEGADGNNFTSQLGQVRGKPYLPSSLQQLCLSGISEKLLQPSVQCQRPSSSSTFSHMMPHKSLQICHSNMVTDLSESIGELHSLQNLTINWFPRLSSLPQSIGYLTSLQQLQIRSCHALEQLPECLGELCFLRILHIERLPSLTRLPQSMGSLTCLESLSIKYCPSLASLPEEMEYLSSLEELLIKNCPGLTSLPQGMEGLTSLKKLTLKCCPGIKSLPEGTVDMKALEEFTIWGCIDVATCCQRGMETGHPYACLLYVFSHEGQLKVMNCSCKSSPWFDDRESES